MSEPWTDAQTADALYDSRPDTYEHIGKVQDLLGQVIENLLARMVEHDKSKLLDPEVKTFDKYTPMLKDLVYGSDEYKACLKAMAPALEHHYAENPHHPEHFEDGIRGMSLLDLIEMLVDWYAASQRMRPSAPSTRGDVPDYDSDFARSVTLNKGRFGYGDELEAVLLNTARELGMIET
jgi:hypothetical protein